MTKNFQTDNFKYTNNRYDIYNPEFNSNVQVVSDETTDSFTLNLNKWIDFVSWARWYPDLFFDLITPESGGIRLDLDQRVLMRCIARFFSVYGVFPRGWSKTFLEVLMMYHTAIFFPDIELAMTAQTKENASKLLEEKHREITKFYPLIKNEIVSAKFPRDDSEIVFTSGGRIDVLANSQTSKGRRRKRLNIEESALLNNELFEDALEPIVNIPRRTIGKLGVVNPEELNGFISFFSTSGYRGTDEYERNLRMIDEMAELKGKMVLGSSWELAVSYERGETRNQILDKKATLSPTFFAQNYESKWVGAKSGALVDIKKVLNLRTISKPDLEAVKDGEYFLSMDVARSEKDSNNLSSIVVFKVKRNKNEKITNIEAVNIISLPNGLNFSNQALELKRIKKLYNANVVVIDGNGIGSGIVDEVMKRHIDPDTGEDLGCWNTINTEHEPEEENAEECVWVIMSQNIETNIIVNFIDVVEGEVLALLEKKQNSGYNIDNPQAKNEIIPYVETDILIEEIANLKTKRLPSGRLSIERITKGIRKDRYSAIAYGCYYIMKYENDYVSNNEYEVTDFCFVN